MTETVPGFEGLRAISCTLTEAGATWPCQVTKQVYLAGVGYRFEYCDQRQAYLATWATEGRRHSSERRYICRRHALGFATRRGLVVPGLIEGQLEARIAAAPARDVDDPFGDAEQPYARTRVAGSRGGGSNVPA